MQFVHPFEQAKVKRLWLLWLSLRGLQKVSELPDGSQGSLPGVFGHVPLPLFVLTLITPYYSTVLPKWRSTSLITWGSYSML